MKRTTTNKLNMYQSVSSVMSEFQSVWQPVPAFVSAMSNFSSKLDLLRIRLTEQASTTTGVSAEKSMRLSDLRERILVLQNALKIYGIASGNIVLSERNKKTKTEVNSLNIPKLAVRCAELKSDLDLYGHDLADFGITSEMITEILPMLSSIDELNHSTRLAILRRKGITASIRELERSLDKLLGFDMDALILVFKKSQPAFFNAFKNARVVVDYGHHGKAPERDDGQPS